MRPRVCPRCHRSIPEVALTSKSGHVGVFGPKSVGKSTFLAVLIHELDHRIGPEMGFAIDPIDDATRERYQREYQDVTYGASTAGMDPAQVASFVRRSHPPTPSFKQNPSVLEPLAYRLSTRASRKRAAATLSFFDTSGTDWETNLDLLRKEARHLDRLRGILFLIDPLRIRTVAQDRRLHLTAQEKRIPPADYWNDFRKLITLFSQSPVKTPLAICLNKLDRWGRLLPKETKLYEWACGVPESAADEKVDLAIHDEVQSALRQWGATGFLENVGVNFPNHRYFACSTLGDAAQERDDQPQPLPTPLLVERPILWLLRKQRVL